MRLGYPVKLAVQPPEVEVYFCTGFGKLGRIQAVSTRLVLQISTAVERRLVWNFHRLYHEFSPRQIYRDSMQ